MKTRSDFVSNSSSSSFILKDPGFFSYFGITKQELDDAITELCGGKDRMAARLDAEVKDCMKRIADHKNGEMMEYDMERLDRLMSEGLACWRIYDMTDEKDRKACYEKYDEHFSSWFAPAEGENEDWDKFVDMLRYKCDIYNVMSVIAGKSAELEESEYDRSTGQWKRTALPGMAKLVLKVKKKLGVKTMKEVLHDENCTMMIHFEDNEVYNIEGMTEEGKDDIDDDCSENAAGKKYESEMYSSRRFFEILIKHFVKTGRIDLSDPEFMESWLVPEDHWWKTDKNSRYKNRKYFTIDGKTVTWEDVYNMLGCNAVMHEG